MEKEQFQELLKLALILGADQLKHILNKQNKEEKYTTMKKEQFNELMELVATLGSDELKKDFIKMLQGSMENKKEETKPKEEPKPKEELKPKEEPKESLYKKAQNEWVKEFEAKDGSKVKIVRKSYGPENFWSMTWTKNMSDEVGKEDIIDKILESGIKMHRSGLIFPFSCLQLL